MALTRHQIREKAFQTLFAINMNPDANLDTVYQQVLHDTDQVVPVPDYLVTLVSGVIEHQSEFDEEITKHLSKGWQLNRLARPDLIILRLALFENQYVDDVPSKVAINEALELAKSFSDDDSRRFINGILSASIESA